MSGNEFEMKTTSQTEVHLTEHIDDVCILGLSAFDYEIIISIINVWTNVELSFINKLKISCPKLLPTWMIIINLNVTKSK